MRKIFEVLGLLISATLFLSLPGVVYGQTAQLSEVINEEADVGGVDQEIDAAPAQVDAMEAGDPVELSPRERERVEEIVVSARKRDELLQETPVSITALDATTLSEAGITDLRDVRNLVPNMQFEASPVSATTSSSIRIRGVGTPGVGTSFDPGVGVYVDGIYMSRSLSSILDLADIAQVEVLRGPQGTLFGKNTVGGAMNLTTTKPSTDLEGFASVRVANFGTVSSRASLDTPITDWLATRLTFVTKNSDGWFDNTYRNETLADRNVAAFLGSLRILATQDITIDISGNYYRSHQNGQGNTCKVQEGAEPAFGPSLLPRLFEACAETTPTSSTANVDQVFSDRQYGIWGSMNWDIGAASFLDEWSVTLKGAWRKGTFDTRQDLDATYLPVVAAVLTASGEDASASTTGSTYVGELQSNFSSWDGRIQGVVGFFGFYEDTLLPTNVIADVGLFDRKTLTLSAVKNYDIAGYGQVSADLTEWLEVTGGLRWTEEKKKTNVYRKQTQSGVVIEDGSANDSEIFRKWTPMASVSATMPDEFLGDAPVDHLMGYFTYSQGFRGGGFNSTATGSLDLTPFQPESLNSFEVGVKTALFDRRLEFSLSAFLYKYKDLQVLAVEGECLDPEDPTSCATQQVVTNAADATGRGLEIELNSRPFGPLFINGSVGLLHTQYDNFDDAPPELRIGAPGEVVNRSGESFNNAPELQTHVAIMAPLPINVFESSWLNGYLIPRLDWYYQSKMHMNAIEVTAANQPGYNLLHARLSYSFMDDRAQISLFGTNLTDTSYMLFSQNLAPYFGFVSAVYGQPRSFGGEISYRFD